jgi:hypothetical protein
MSVMNHNVIFSRNVVAKIDQPAMRAVRRRQAKRNGLRR